MAKILNHLICWQVSLHSRFENAVTANDLIRLGIRLAETTAAALPNATKHVYLDIDATDDPTHGQQELALFDGHCGTRCYLPLLAFITEDDGAQHLMGALLCSAAGRSVKGVMRMVRKAVRILRPRFPSIQITVRGDCGFGYGKLINWCQCQKVDYLLAVQSTKPMRAKALWAEMEVAVWHRYQKHGYCVYDECMHQAGSWKQRYLEVQSG